MIVDADVHNYLPDSKELHPYLSALWRQHLESVSITITGPYPGATYPKLHPYAARVDAWPPGKLPGSDLDFMRAQLLDAWHIDYAVLNTLHFAGQQRVADFAIALASALNDWQVERWLSQDSRLRAAIIVPHEDGPEAAAEIERCARDNRFVQVLLPVRTREPYGRRKYWPLYEAAERNRLPIGIHFGGSPGWPITGAGWPSFYYEDHTGKAESLPAHLVSPACEGVYERFPALQVDPIADGFTCLAQLM